MRTIPAGSKGRLESIAVFAILGMNHSVLLVWLLRGWKPWEADAACVVFAAIMIDRMLHASSRQYSSGGRLQAWS